MCDDQLPWERRGGTGICLSGGGIRAAVFALGALQALQKERGLLFGERSAEYLAAVSGGGYTAAALALNAKALEEATPDSDPPPLAEQSPEAEWIMRNGDYIKRLGRSSPGSEVWWLVTIAVMLAFAAFNLLGFLSLFALAGGLLAGVGQLFGDTSGAVGWTLGLLAGGAIWLLIRLLYELPRPWIWLFVMLAFAAAGSHALTAGSREAVAWLDEQLAATSTAGAVVGGGLLLLAYCALSVVRFRPEPIARAAASIATLLPRAVGLVALAVCTDRASRIGISSPMLIIGSLAIGFILTIVLSRVSLHRLNRDRIANCFARVRDGEGEPRKVAFNPLSGVAPAGWPKKRASSFPRLMLGATANVRRRSGQWAGTFEPFTFSYDYCWLARDTKAHYKTKKLEAGRRPAWGWGSEPVMTLMTAVATAGAAVCPSMGNKTSRGGRSAMALLNLRLGTWFPNVVSPGIRAEVESDDSNWWLPKSWWKLPRHVALGGGYDEFVPELFGLDNDTAPRLYASDGGHYDNLGLLMLLRARCERIWCVDSQADRDGKASQLRQVVSLAEDSGLVKTISLDYDAFKRHGEWHGASHSTGEITYDDGSTAELIVIKLALTEDSPQDLKDYHKHDAWWQLGVRRWLKFPADATFARPSFDEKRMRNYCKLGRENATRAVQDVGP